MERAGRDEWTKRVGLWKRSGLKARAFAERERFNVNTLWWWSSRLGSKKQELVARPATFVEVVMPKTPAISAAVIEVVLRDGVRVSVPIDFDENTLRRLLRVIEVG